MWSLGVWKSRRVTGVVGVYIVFAVGKVTEEAEKLAVGDVM